MLTPAHVDLYCRIKSNPGWQGGSPEDAAIFCELVERRLDALSVWERTVVMLQACGYTQYEIARDAGVSLRTMSRKITALNGTLFADLSAALGVRCKIRGTKSSGKPRKTR